MSKAAMPTSGDLKKLLYSSGLVDSPMNSTQSIILYDQTIAAAINEWEERVAYRPFLASAVDTIRYFDPPGPERNNNARLYSQLGAQGGGNRLFFTGGYVSVTSIYKSITPQSVTGTLLTSGTDYWLKPTEAPDENSPYTWIEFAAPVYGLPGSVKVTGKPGYSSVIDDSAWDIVLKIAGLKLLPSLELILTKGVSLVEQGDVKIRYGTGSNASPYSAIRDQWRIEIKSAVGRYLRVLMV